MIKQVLTGLLLAAGSLGAAAQHDSANPAVSEAADSVSAALATVWSSHITPVLEKSYPGNSNAQDEFMRGINDAFGTSAEQEPYYQGILQGFTIIERLGQMQQLGFPINRESFIKALAIALSNGDTGFTPASADRYLSEYMTHQYEQTAIADTLSMESQQQFLDREAAREGVLKTPSGLLFEVITEGEGAGPSLDDAVTVSYTGKLYNGEIFDESPTEVTFPVSGLVPGFTQGLLMMKPGGTYRIIIPPDLGYGPSGTAGVIPGNAALDFTITLHRVVKR